MPDINNQAKPKIVRHCLWAFCPFTTTKGIEDLEIHAVRVHGLRYANIQCPWPTCFFTFRNRLELAKHHGQVHRLTAAVTYDDNQTHATDNQHDT